MTSQLVDPNDPWDLLHYRERISIYYRDDQKAVSLILDHLAVENDAASVNDLFAMLKGASPFDDRDRLLRLLSLLRTGINYVKAGGKDSGILLTLTSPERAILKQSLGLAETDDAKAT